MQTETNQLNKWMKNCVCVCKLCKDTHSPPPTPTVMTTSPHATAALERPTPAQGLVLSTTLHGVEYPFRHSRQLSPPCSLPASCPPSAYSPLSQSEKLRRPWCCASTAQLNSWCVVPAGLVIHLNYSSLWANVKKINSIPDKFSTGLATKLSKSARWKLCGQGAFW